MVSSLVTDRRNVPWGTRQCRSYQRILSGINRAQAEGKKLRVLTLTSAPGSPGGVQLSKNWQTLRKRIQRRMGVRLEYFRMRTVEGHGVLHIVYKGPYISQKWLSKAWNSIHGAYVVFIQALHGRKRLARYLVSSYLAGHHAFSRSSWSWNWVFYGFVGYWKRVIKTSLDMSTAIFKWNIMLRTKNPRKWYLENRRKKWWKDVSSIYEFFEQYPYLNKLSGHRLEMIISYIVHHPQCDSGQSVLDNYLKQGIHRGLPRSPSNSLRPLSVGRVLGDP